jgi:hypothetical protein
LEFESKVGKLNIDNEPWNIKSGKMNFYILPFKEIAAMFKNDLFTKGILTVIALNLSILTVSNLIPNTENTVNTAVVPINEDGSITVRLSNAETLDVNISRISTMDELDVNIEEIGGGFLSHGGPIPVTIED